MKNELLPIGTVCSINKGIGNDTKIMILGYIPIQYRNRIQKYDYCGCFYPEGIMSGTNQILFNKSDIIEVFYMGYETAESKYLSDFLLKINLEIENDNNKYVEEIMIDIEDEKRNIEENTKRPIISNGFIFDEDGYLVKEDLTKLKNPFKNEIPEVKIDEKENAKPEKWDIFKEIKFDSEGFVIADGTEEAPKEEKFSGIKFDSNGFVIAE